MLNKNFLRALAGACLLVGAAIPATAGVMLAGTRVIFGERDREASIPVKNTGNSPYVVQTWVEGDDASQEIKAPFIVTPPLSRLDPGAENILRIIRLPSGSLPSDRESVFRLNVKEIPERAKEDNVLQIAIRSRIKLFYRPSTLPGKAGEAPEQLKWAVMADEKRQGAVLKVGNPSAYHVTFTALTINGGQQKINADMVPPLGEAVYPLTTLSAPQAIEVSYTTINDYGSELPRQMVKVPAAAVPMAVKPELVVSDVDAKR
jgi:fimbrial chaperone protein